MRKNISLSDALQEASGKTSITSAHRQAQVRKGTKIVSGHFDLEVNRQLKQIALNHDTTIQKLLAEALNDLFVKYKAKPIA